MRVFSVMNNTKWDEVRLAMYGLHDLAPRWRTKAMDADVVRAWDREWFYHFRIGGYEGIEWLEIEALEPLQHEAVLAVLRAIRVPGSTTEFGFRIYGYVGEGTAIDYI